MWEREYRNYKRDKPLVQQELEPGKGLIGCEMHELNGWGNTLDRPQGKKRGFLASLLIDLFKDF